MTRHAVVIVGGGPTGLMLAGELALAGVDVAIVERRASQDALDLVLPQRKPVVVPRGEVGDVQRDPGEPRDLGHLSLR